MMTIGVLGGGLQGCCTALALAERGSKVVLFDRNQSLLSRTATSNEGKIHLGYMYAGDPTFATARTMIKGALEFAPFMQRYLGLPIHQITTSTATNYVVHRDSQHSTEEVSAYLAGVHRLIAEASNGCKLAYFGMDLSTPLRMWPAGQRDAVFNSEAVLDVFETPEVAIEPHELAVSLGQCISNHPRIEVRLGQNVLRAESHKNAIRVTSETQEGHFIDDFDHVVNALWDGRMALDEVMGLKTNRPWLHRLKYGIIFTLPHDLQCTPTVTLVSGPFGEVVSYRDRRIYLTWYPECLRGISAEITPPDWPTYAPEPVRSLILRRTISAISHILPCLEPLNRASLNDARVKGGIIVAWGDTDIYDPKSELHHRYEIGVTSVGQYHSIDPGKLTMAPYFAEKCAERIVAPS